MTWPVIWSYEAGVDLLSLHYETAGAIGDAVRTWAETGEGWTEPTDGDRIRILARGGYAIVAVDMGRGAIFVLRVVGAEPLPVLVPLLDGPEDDDD
jgi:hypothetical protein